MKAGDPVRPGVAEVVMVAAILEDDETRKSSELDQRDRTIGATLERGADTARTLLQWMSEVCRMEPGKAQLYANASRMFSWLDVSIFFLGLVLGWLTALGVFFFDGSGRVNVVSVLAVLVLLPGLFLLFFIAAALPVKGTSKVPGIAAIAALAGSLSPGRLTGLISRLFPGRVREGWEVFTGQIQRHRALFQNLEKWAMLRWSQLFAVGFQVAALLAAVSLVVFSDLAFGWSTTLSTGDVGRDAEITHRIVSVVAAPWSWALDAAVPSMAFVEDSRFFRAAGGKLTQTEAAKLGAWWPFLIISIAIYGLLPRLATCFFSGRRMEKVSRYTLESLPGLIPLRHRLHEARVQTAATLPDAETGTHVDGGSGPSGIPTSLPGSTAVVINWAAVPVEKEVLTTCFSDAPVYSAGGALAVDAEPALAAEIAANVQGEKAVIVLVKAWEPPLMDLMDFLKTLRLALPEKTPIRILPVQATSGGPLLSGSGKDLEVWKRKIAAEGDPWLRVSTLSRGTA